MDATIKTWSLTDLVVMTLIGDVLMRDCAGVAFARMIEVVVILYVLVRGVL